MPHRVSSQSAAKSESRHSPRPRRTRRSAGSTQQAACSAAQSVLTPPMNRLVICVSTSIMWVRPSRGWLLLTMCIRSPHTRRPESVSIRTASPLQRSGWRTSM